MMVITVSVFNRGYYSAIVWCFSDYWLRRTVVNGVVSWVIWCTKIRWDQWRIFLGWLDTVT